MKEITLREANQQFSKLIREVEETGETVIVLRNGKPAAEIGPPKGAATGKLTLRQERALKSLLDSARNNPGNSAGQPRLTRDELHDR